MRLRTGLFQTKLRSLLWKPQNFEEVPEKDIHPKNVSYSRPG